MNFVYERISRWIPSKYDDIKGRNSLMYLYTTTLGLNFSPLFRQYNNRIKMLKYDFVESVIASGAMCFFGSLLMSLCQIGRVKNIDDLFTFAACYILTDHYIDDNTISKSDKAKTIAEINSFIDSISPNTDNEIPIESEIIQAVAANYIKLINKIPESNYHLKKMFRVEVETMYLQSNSNLSREKYIELSEWKGGLFCNAIQSILELEVTQAEYDLGAAIQLMDDILDVEDDLHLGINTAATYDYKTYGNLDKIMEYVVGKVDELDAKYTVFKPVLYLGLTWAVHNSRSLYSDEMVKIMDHFIYYQPTTTKNNMIMWMKESIENS